LLELTDGIIIWCAKNDKSFRRVPSISQIFSKASVDKIMAGDTKLAEDLGLELSEQAKLVISKLPEVKEELAIAITGGGVLNLAQAALEELALEKGLSAKGLEYLNAWRMGAGVRAQRQIIVSAEKMYGSGKSLLRYKAGNAADNGTVHSSGDYGMPERHAKTIALRAMETWAVSSNDNTSTILYSGYLNNRQYQIRNDRVDIDCQCIPRQEVEWLVEARDWII
jgi:hypothetical protein